MSSRVVRDGVAVLAAAAVALGLWLLSRPTESAPRRALRFGAAREAAADGTAGSGTGSGGAELPRLDPSSGEAAPLAPPPVEQLLGRPASEWQGMLVDLAVMPPCEIDEQCGLARACRDGQCGPCEADADCAADEGCVLDHCVKATRIECRRSADCPDGLCILTGYSDDPRGNRDMTARCNPSSGGQPVVELAEPPGRPAPPPAVDADDLRRKLRGE
jgi:hypothetical protein